MALQARGEIDRIYVHWTAGHYSQFFDDYHINIDFDGSIYISTTLLNELKSHTWRRNSRAVGIAAACCYQATTNGLGPKPPTVEQLNSLALVIRLLCDGLELPIDYDHVRTHAEQADEDDYGPATTCERWDFWFLRDGDEPGTGGDELRRMAAA
jgi:hypothetical protein